MPNHPIFVGRKAELKRWEEILREGNGGAVVVVGNPGMGKTSLLDEMMEWAEAIPDLNCGSVRYEVTKSDTPDTVMDLMMRNAFETASDAEGSFVPTEKRQKQWRALLKVAGIVPGVDELATLIASLKHDPARFIRDQFLTRLNLLSNRMPTDGRAIFIIDPGKYLAPNTADAWRLVIQDLPPKVILVIGQRPDDEIAKDLDGDLGALDNLEQLPPEPLGALDDDAIAEFAQSASIQGLTASQILAAIKPYGGYPFSLGAALKLLEDGLSPEDLPNERGPKSPTAFARKLWSRVKQEHGTDAIKIFEALAILEVAAPKAVVRETAAIDAPTMNALLAQPLIASLLREEDAGDEPGFRLYHALFADEIKSGIDEPNHYHTRAITELRTRLNREKPDLFAARRLWRHVLEAEGPHAGIDCAIAECTPKIVTRGDLVTAEADGRELLEILPAVLKNTTSEAAILGNLGIVLRTRGDLDGAEAMHRKSLEIEERLGRIEGMASDYGNLGIVLSTRGDLDGAEAMYRKALELNQRLGRIEGMAIQYGNLGIVLKTRGDLDGAREHWLKARDLFTRLGAQHMADQMQSWINTLDQPPPNDA